MGSILVTHLTLPVCTTDLLFTTCCCAWYIPDNLRHPFLWYVCIYHLTSLPTPPLQREQTFLSSLSGTTQVQVTRLPFFQTVPASTFHCCVYYFATIRLNIVGDLPVPVLPAQLFLGEGIN